MFSKSFLSFSKDKNISEEFLNNNDNENKSLTKVLYILEKDDKIDFSLSTHTIIEKISFMPEEKEVLFFPFSSFEIKGLTEKTINNEIIYEIKLLYLTKYIDEIEKTHNIINIENQIPDCEFKNQIIELGLINKDYIINPKQIYNQYIKHKKDINITNDDLNNNKLNNNINTHLNNDINKEIINNKNKELINNNDKKAPNNNINRIIAKIIIDKDNINEDIRIINSFEEA